MKESKSGIWGRPIPPEFAWERDKKNPLLLRRYGNAVAMLDKTMMRYTHPRIINTFFDNADLYGIKSGAGSGGLKRRKGSCKEKGSPHSESY